jgi:hypothetical protein
MEEEDDDADTSDASQQECGSEENCKENFVKENLGKEKDEGNPEERHQYEHAWCGPELACRFA